MHVLIPDASKRQLRAVAHCPQRALEPVGWLIVMQKALEPIELLSRGNRIASQLHSPGSVNAAHTLLSTWSMLLTLSTRDG